MLRYGNTLCESNSEGEGDAKFCQVVSRPQYVVVVGGVAAVAAAKGAIHVGVH